jgi:hypothetical protein
MLERSTGWPIVVNAESLIINHDIPMDESANPNPLELSATAVASRLPSYEERPDEAAEESRRATPVTHATWLAFACALYILALIIPLGWTAFSFALGLLFQFPRLITQDSLWDLPIAASWLANPALWLGAVFLAKRDWRLAKRLGFVALLFGLLAAHVGALIVAYWVWIGSMVMFLVAAYKCSGVTVSAGSGKPRPVDPDF